MPTTIAEIRARPLRPAVRLPFRILAGLWCLLIAVVMMSTPFLAWHKGIHTLPDELTVCKCLLWLPGMIWLTRMFYYAARSGKVPDDVAWPFASGAVSNGYYWIVILFDYLY
jgi:hypothetical protein